MNIHQFLNNVVFMVLLSSACTVKADWCSGDKYGFWNMSVSEQIQQAGKKLRQMHDAVQLETLRLKLDVEPELREYAKSLKEQRQKRVLQTESLCKQANSSAYPVYFEGIALKTPIELVAKLKLELEQVRSLEIAMKDVAVKQLQIVQISRALKDHSTVLELNNRQQTALLKSDVKTEQVRHYLLNACAARDTGRDLLLQSRIMAIEGPLRKVKRQFNPPEVNETDVNRLLTHCRIKTAEMINQYNSPWVDRVMDSVKNWF